MLAASCEGGPERDEETGDTVGIKANPTAAAAVCSVQPRQLLMKLQLVRVALHVCEPHPRVKSRLKPHAATANLKRKLQNVQFHVRTCNSADPHPLRHRLGRSIGHETELIHLKPVSATRHGAGGRRGPPAAAAAAQAPGGGCSGIGTRLCRPPGAGPAHRGRVREGGEGEGGGERKG